MLSLKRYLSAAIDLNSLEGLIIIFNITWCDIQCWQLIRAGSLGDDDIQMVDIWLSFNLLSIASWEINIFIFIVYVYKEKKYSNHCHKCLCGAVSTRGHSVLSWWKSPSVTTVRTEGTPSGDLVTFWPNSIYSGWGQAFSPGSMVTVLAFLLLSTCADSNRIPPKSCHQLYPPRSERM